MLGLLTVVALRAPATATAAIPAFITAALSRRVRAVPGDMPRLVAVVTRLVSSATTAAAVSTAAAAAAAFVPCFRAISCEMPLVSAVVTRHGCFEL